MSQGFLLVLSSSKDHLVNLFIAANRRSGLIEPPRNKPTLGDLQKPTLRLSKAGASHNYAGTPASREASNRSDTRAISLTAFEGLRKPLILRTY